MHIMPHIAHKTAWLHGFLCKNIVFVTKSMLHRSSEANLSLLILDRLPMLDELEVT